MRLFHYVAILFRIADKYTNNAWKDKEKMAKIPLWGIKFIKILPQWGIFYIKRTLNKFFVVILQPCLKKRQTGSLTFYHGRKLESLFVVFSSTAAKLQQKTCLGFVLYRKSLIEGGFWWILSLIEGFLPFFLCPFKHYLYICQRFWKGSRHNGKGAYLALCSWRIETSQTSCIVRT